MHTTSSQIHAAHQAKHDIRQQPVHDLGFNFEFDRLSPERIDGATQTVFTLLHSQDRVTHNFFDSDTSVRTRSAGTVLHQFTMEVPGMIEKQTIYDFICQHKAELGDPKISLGAHYDKDDGKTFVYLLSSKR